MGGELGGWIAGLEDVAWLEAAAVTVEAAPDSGYRLRHEVEMNIHADAPQAAKAILREVVRTYPEGSATVRAWVSLTFSAALRSGSRKREPGDIARDLACRIPGLGARLQATGTGIARPKSAQELCEVVRIAYDAPAALTSGTRTTPTSASPPGDARPLAPWSMPARLRRPPMRKLRGQGW